LAPADSGRAKRGGPRAEVDGERRRSMALSSRSQPPPRGHPEFAPPNVAGGRQRIAGGSLFVAGKSPQTRRCTSARRQRVVAVATGRRSVAEASPVIARARICASRVWRPTAFLELAARGSSEVLLDRERR
jgi:hypothetical protein